MEQTFKKLQKEWKDKVLQLDKVTFSDGLTSPGKPTGGSVSEYGSNKQRSCSNVAFVIAGKRQSASKLAGAEQ